MASTLAVSSAASPERKACSAKVWATTRRSYSSTCGAASRAASELLALDCDLVLQSGDPALERVNLRTGRRFLLDIRQRGVGFRRRSESAAMVLKAAMDTCDGSIILTRLRNSVMASSASFVRAFAGLDLRRRRRDRAGPRALAQTVDERFRLQDQRIREPLRILRAKGLDAQGRDASGLVILDPDKTEICVNSRSFVGRKKGGGNRHRMSASGRSNAFIRSAFSIRYVIASRERIYSFTM